MLGVGLGPQVYNTAEAVLSCAPKAMNLLLDMFLVQHDMESMHMWVFKERTENALGKMQLRSYILVSR
jgi:hypothetical protein